MKIHDIITESHDLDERRSHPELNTGREGFDGALQFLQQIAPAQLGEYGITMTTIPKVGVNPNAQDPTTPAGVYFYPAKYFITIKSKGAKLPFSDNAPYINILKLTHATEVGEMPLEEYQRMRQKVVAAIPKLSQEFGVSERSIVSYLNEHMPDIKQSAPGVTFGSTFWKALQGLSKSMLPFWTKVVQQFKGQKPNQNQAARSTLIFNKMLRTIGISTAIDSVKAAIHNNEPAQGVILNPRDVQVVRQFSNNQTVKQASQQRLSQYQNKQIDDLFSENI